MIAAWLTSLAQMPGPALARVSRPLVMANGPRPTQASPANRAAGRAGRCLLVGSIRGLKLGTPAVRFRLADRERLVRCVRLAVRDPGLLGGPVDRQVDHLAGRPGRRA